VTRRLATELTEDKPLTQGEHVVEAGRDGGQHLPSKATSAETRFLAKDWSNTSRSAKRPTEQGEANYRSNDGFGQEPPPKLVNRNPNCRQGDEPVNDETQDIGGGSLGVCWHLVGDVGDGGEKTS
jgi:hypothetical protein